MKAVDRAVRSFSRSFTLTLALALAAPACHHEVAPAPKVSAAPPAPPPVPRAHTTTECEMKTTRATPSASGEATVVGGDGKPHALYWTRLSAKTQPARGTLFYLAGGPISHMNYTDLAAAFQRVSFPQLDVVLYDYFGFNCSSPLQDTAALGAQFPNLTMKAMAHDFIQLKRGLVGPEQKAFLMGGSHGAMLGAEIVRDYPTEIEKAVLFSGDTESGWLDDGWFRFDRLMTKLDAAHPGFASGLHQLLESAAAGKLEITRNEKQVIVDRPTLEVALWLVFSLDSAAQAALPDLVKSAEKGERKWIAGIYGAALALLEPVTAASPPTEVSVVTNFHRCNVWFPKSARSQRSEAPAQPAQFFRHDSFVHYWNTLCKDYDVLGESPWRAGAAPPASVPVLTWVGDQDTFDPETTHSRWSALSSNVSFQVMEGWSHDFGPKTSAGFMRAAELVKTFCAP
jgi:pimeloyl-ACP methyl ester carboxylesterase